MHTLELRVSNAELIYFFDIPTDVCIKGVQTRTERPDMPCKLPENEDDKLIEFIKSFNAERKPLILDLLNKYRDKKVIIFHSHKEIDNYIKEIQLNKNN